MGQDLVVEVALKRLRAHGDGRRRLDHKTLEILRTAAVAQMDAGVGVREIATAFGMSRSTLYRWRALAGRRGEPASPRRPADHAPGDRTGEPPASGRAGRAGSPLGEGAGHDASADPYTDSAVTAAACPPPERLAALRERVLGEPLAGRPTDAPLPPLWDLEAVRAVLAELTTDAGDAHAAAAGDAAAWDAANARDADAADAADARDAAWDAAAWDAAAWDAAAAGVPALADAPALLRAAGLWPDHPLRRPHELADEGWLKSVLPRIRERARAEGARLYFVEDALVGDGALWLLSAVPAAGGLRRFAVYDPAREGADDYLRFLEDFLQRLGEEADTPVYAVLEPLPAKDARAVARFASASGDRLRLFFLPDVLMRLERLSERWREALATMREYAAARDETARGYRAAKSAEERLRLDRDRAIRSCREAGVPITTIVSGTGLAAKTIYDALGRTSAPADHDAAAAPAAVRRERLAALDAAMAAWRESVAALRDHARERERAVAAYRAAKTVEERLRLRRDKAIVAWRTTGIAAGVLAARTGLSNGLISQITGKRPPAAGEPRHGESGRLLDALERVSEQWRQAVAEAEERARVRQEAADACRAGRAVEERLRQSRDQVITACQAAAVPIPDIALCAGLDVTTVYQMLHANKFAPGDALRADRVRLMSRLREVSTRWRQAAEAVRGHVRAREEATRAWRESRAAEEELRRRRDKAITECRAADVAVTVLASYTRLDISTIYGVCQAPGA
ncbi:helix-turn-helix domain-containing protein [Thermopolyspora sp. NPDC052614]|uniref:helix-turn-helix domain-containing protein n=1 Tax=Thermopolyspora sp. NPDC052614 TaxID=3155682 RepID=UPI0034465A9C